ncbi:hypothetical protein B0A49_07045, partial [Cryomyces minteri]
KHLIEKSTRKKLFFDSLGKPRVTVSSKGKRRRPSSKTLNQALKCDDEAFLDFIARCLRWDPDRRLKPDEAIVHDFVIGNKKSRTTRQPTTGTNGGGAVSGGLGSPMKRLHSTATASAQATPSRYRILPETPVTSFKNGTAASSQRDAPSGSPIKASAGIPAMRRHSTVAGPGAVGLTVGVKRTSNGTLVPGTNGAVLQGSASGLPRTPAQSGGSWTGTGRSMSGKPDMAASAAAIASLHTSPDASPAPLDSSTPSPNREEMASKNEPVPLSEANALPTRDAVAAAASLPVYDATGQSQPFSSLYTPRPSSSSSSSASRHLIIFVRHFFCGL